MQNLSKHKHDYDVVVVGGGISGIGAARACARRGFRTLLIERKTLSSATSNNSLRIIHGGFRYLQTGNIKRVAESAKAQLELLSTYPDYIKPLRCMMPLKARGLKSAFPVRIALGAYSLISQAVTGKSLAGRLIRRSTAELDTPLLKGHVNSGALVWNDAFISDPEGFGAQLAEEIQESGCELKEDCLVTSFKRDESGFTVSFDGDGPGEITTSVLVTTLGPWMGRTADSKGRADIKWCKAFNIILNKLVERKTAIGLEGDDSRLYFLVPRKDRSVLGTFYVPYAGAPEDVGVGTEEVERVIAEFGELLPEASVTMDDVAGVEVGVLPMREVRRGEPVLFGAEKIFSFDGFIEVMSTKYTTFVPQGERVAAIAGRFLKGSA